MNKTLAGCINIELGSIKVPGRQQSIIDKLDDAQIYYSFYGNHWESCGIMVLIEDEETAMEAVNEWKREYIVELQDMSLEYLLRLYQAGEITGEEFKHARNIKDND